MNSPLSQGYYLTFLIFIGIIALGALVQMIVLAVIAIGLAKAVKKGEQELAELKGHVLPLIAKSRDLVEDLTPKLKTVTANLVDVTNTIRSQVKDISGTVSHANETAQDVVKKTEGQIARVDEMVTAVLDTVTTATENLQSMVMRPMRQVNGIYAGLKTGLNVLLSKGQHSAYEAPAANTRPYDVDDLHEVAERFTGDRN
jgi:methyl-accepting chemotaxis protein